MELKDIPPDTFVWIWNKKGGWALKVSRWLKRNRHGTFRPSEVARFADQLRARGLDLYERYIPQQLSEAEVAELNALVDRLRDRWRWN